MAVLRKSFLAFSMAALMVPSIALADVRAPDGRVIECYCTDRYGKRHELGDIICLTVGGRSYMAKCVMAQNNPFWRDQKRGCLSSKNTKPITPFPSELAFLPSSAKICG